MIAQTLISFLFISTSALAQSGPSVEPVIREPVSSVSMVDLRKYVGRWYEVASIPQKFSEGCHCTTADYSLNRDGTLKVVNTCRLNNPAGKLSVAEGRAFVQDDTNAKLKVSFVLSWFPGLRKLFSGDYWITSLSENYDTAVISNPKGTTMWVLSRTPKMETKVFENIVAVARKSINVGKLKYQNQRGCAYTPVN